jgi:hypothetical protein
MCVRRTLVLAGRTDLRMTTRKLGCPTEYPRVPPDARGGPAAAAARSLRSPATLASRDRIGDRVIVRIVDVRRLLSGESNRQQPSR